jgi:hypothetical protein
MMIIVILIIPDICLIQHVYASACACMLTSSTASSDAPSSTSTRTVSACPRSLAHSNAVLRYFCQYSQVITVQRSIRLDEREHAHAYMYSCEYMHIYTHTQTSPMCVDSVCVCVCVCVRACVCACVCARAPRAPHAFSLKKSAKYGYVRGHGYQVIREKVHSDS